MSVEAKTGKHRQPRWNARLLWVVMTELQDAEMSVRCCACPSDRVGHDISNVRACVARGYAMRGDAGTADAAAFCAVLAASRAAKACSQAAVRGAYAVSYAYAYGALPATQGFYGSGQCLKNRWSARSRAKSAKQPVLRGKSGAGARRWRVARKRCRKLACMQQTVSYYPMPCCM
jgi:hypothetical protein